MNRQKNQPSSFVPFVFAALFLLFPALLLICGLALPPQYEDTFLGELKYKVKRLRETEGKRIVLTGGSSVPFGVNSGLLAEYFPAYEIVNFGMYADLGTVAMLDLAGDSVREGDIYILMPEQNSQTLSCHFSGESFWQAADGAPDLIPLLSPKRYERLAAAFPAFAGKKLYYAVNGSPKPSGVYARDSFNAYGDISCGGREYNIMAGGCQPNDPIRFDKTVISGDFLEEINSFAAEAVQKGAAVYYHFPPMNGSALISGVTGADIDAYYDLLQEKLSFPILGNPHRCIMESGWFYDTNFHLNAGGAAVFTKYLIEDLKTALHDTSRTDIPLPSMPAAPVFSTEGDSKDAGCFTYRREPEGWFIDGLTRQGQSASTLVIPACYEEEPVIGMSDTLFAGNTAIRELTVQPNAGVLYDGMFRGCSAFEKLILTGPPSSYSVGGGLMEGAGFLIFVPGEEAENYRLDYSWQEYGAYISPLPDR